MFGELGIDPALLADAHVQRVSDAQARQDFGVLGPPATDMGGLIFPYFSPANGRRTTARLRRDHPELVDGKLRNKYISAWGDSRHLYFPPGAATKLENLETPIVLVEAEKSALSLTAWAERMGMDLLPLGIGGCWGWRGQRIAKAIAPNGEREDVSGPLPDLDYCSGRRVYALLDANTATNDDVRRARTALISELRKRNRHCSVLLCELPNVDGVNGPDDYIAVHGDEAMAEVFTAAHAPSRKLAVMPAPTPVASKPAVPALTPAEAAARTSDLLDTAVVWITGYVVITTEQAIILAAWILHTYVMDAVEWTPYIHISGPEKSIGKTLLMDVLAALACNPRTASGTTPAALVRIVDKFQPTLFLDEMDASSNGNRELAEAQRGILNAGFQRGKVFCKCDGKDNEVREFNAFGAKCFAGIGDLPGTIASRSIVIEMRRKLRSEHIERYRSRVVSRLAAPIRAELERWGAGVIDPLRAIEPDPIDTLPDRANDVAEILLAVAQLAGGDWTQRLTSALLAVYGSAAADDTSSGVVLLSDIRGIFADRGTVHIPSKELATALCEIEGRPWAEWSRGRGLSANNLAKQLGKYRVYPANIRVDTKVVKGYRRADFGDAWDRYCPYTPISSATPLQPASPLNETAFLNRYTASDVADQKVPQARMDTDLWRCSGANGGLPATELAEAAADAEEREEDLRL
jgi:putative DNA primase/helicase